jgi:hypothetical protein
MSQLPEPPITPSTGFSYVARKPCGCLIAAIADEPEPEKKKKIARVTGEWIQAGYTVEHVTDEVVRAEFRSCIHKKQPQLLFE